jgi:hypothetical protein
VPDPICQKIRITIRVGQFAGQDFYGNAQFGDSFINGAMGYTNEIVERYALCCASSLADFS